jgi:hypothetical protein
MEAHHPQQPTSGHPDDDAVLRLVAEHSDLTKPRDWGQFMFVAHEAAAQALAREVANAGWGITRVEDVGGKWIVAAEKHGAVVDHAAQGAARAFFTELVSHYPGGEYDGWDVGA